MLTTFSYAIVLSAIGIGTATDLRWRRIPNVLTGAAALTGLMAAATGVGHLSVLSALAGLAVGLCLMLPAHVIGATGAGDVKLIAALGSLLGPGAIARVVLYTAIAGGLLALVVALRRGRLRATLAGTAGLATGSGAARDAIVAAGDNRFPYAPAIAIGTLIVLAM